LNRLSAGISGKTLSVGILGSRRPAQNPRYINAATGNDANNGKTAAAAWATVVPANTALAVANNGITHLYLARGSAFAEQLSLLASANGLKVLASGTGNAPVLDGSATIAPGSFTASLHADAGGVVYEYAWTRGTGTQRGFDYVLLWENDARLVRTTSVALCAATAGSYYAPGENTASSTIYIHPFGNTNPILDGKTYAVTIRGAGLDGYATGIQVEGVRTRRGWGHTGPLAAGIGSVVRRSIIEGGGIHHIVTQGSLIEDAVVLDMPRGHSSVITVTFYRIDGTASDALARRVFAAGTLADRTIGQTVYAHTSGSPGWRSVTYDQCVTQYAAGFTADAVDHVYSNSAVLRGRNPIHLNTNDTLLVERVLVNDGLTSVGGLISSSGAGLALARTVTIRDSVIVVDTDAAVTALQYVLRAGTILIENCVIYYGSAVGSNAISLSGFDATSRLAATVRNCIIFTRSAVRAVAKAATCDYVGQNNIFFRTGGSSPWFTHNGSTITSFTAWKTASGTDLTSVEADPGFSGTPAAGDFRLTSGGTGALMGCGPQTHWDYATRSIVAGPPTAWPVIPDTLAEAETYIAAPEAWTFV